MIEKININRIIKKGKDKLKWKRKKNSTWARTGLTDDRLCSKWAE